MLNLDKEYIGTAFFGQRQMGLKSFLETNWGFVQKWGIYSQIEDFVAF